MGNFFNKIYNYKDTLHKARGISSSPRSFLCDVDSDFAPSSIDVAFVGISSSIWFSLSVWTPVAISPFTNSIISSESGWQTLAGHMTVLRSTNAALCLCFMVRLPNLNWLLYTYLMDRQDVFFDYTFRQTLTKFLYSISCKKKKLWLSSGWKG